MTATGDRSQPAWQLALRLLGVLLAPLLVWWTINRTDASPFQALATARVPLFLAALLCVGLTHVLGAWRWGLSLAVQQVHCSWFLLWRLTLAGTFCSQLIPGAVSGDLLKLACLANNHPGKGPEIIISGLLDRIVGVTGLFLVAMLGGLGLALFQPELVRQHPVLGTAIGLVSAGGLASLGVLGALLYHRALLRLRLAAKLVAWLEARLPQKITALIVRLCQAASSYRQHPLRLVATLVISLVIHALLGLAFFLLGRAVGEHHYPFVAYFLAMQVGNAVTLIPATPGGLGLRDAVQVTFFQALAQEQNVTLLGSIPVLHSLLVIFWAFLGAFALLSLPNRRKVAGSGQTA